MRKWISRTLFSVACVGLAWYAWVLWLEALPQYKNETLIVPTILLYVLTFPASLVAQGVYTGLALIVPDYFNMSNVFLNWLYKTWVPLTAIGWIQWFVLFPWWLRK
jgi:hypothetical protein